MTAHIKTRHERQIEQWPHVPGNELAPWARLKLADAEIADLRAALENRQGAAVPADPRPLFDRKLADLKQRGYEVIGRILHKDGEYALFDSSCRWLTTAQYQRLMHEQDGSLFAAPQPPAVKEAEPAPPAARTTSDVAYESLSPDRRKKLDADMLVMEQQMQDHRRSRERRQHVVPVDVEKRLADRRGR